MQKFIIIFSKIFPKREERFILQLWKQACQTDEHNTKKDFDCKGQWFIENWMAEKIKPKRKKQIIVEKNR